MMVLRGLRIPPADLGCLFDEILRLTGCDVKLLQGVDDSCAGSLKPRCVRGELWMRVMTNAGTVNHHGKVDAMAKATTSAKNGYTIVVVT